MTHRRTPWVPVKGPKRYFKSPPGIQRVNTEPWLHTTGQRLKAAALDAANVIPDEYAAVREHLIAAANVYDAEPRV